MTNIIALNLPAADTMIDLGYCLTLSHIKRVTGSVFDLIYGDVLTPELDAPLPVTYEIDKGNIILHEWYKLDDWQEREYIREAVRQFFQSCAA